MKQFFKCMAVVASISLVASLFFSCKQEEDESVQDELKLEKIIVSLADSEKAFVEGGAISAADFIVTAKYSDGTDKPVTEADGVEFIGLGTLKAGVAIITAKYAKVEASLQIVVISSEDLKYDTSIDENGNKITFTEISLALKDSSKTFVEGTVLSASDFVVTAKYSDKSSKSVTEGVHFTPALGERLSAGKVAITVSYGSKQASLEITVSEKQNVSAPDALCIFGNFDESSFQEWIPMEKEGSCFYYEFKETMSGVCFIINSAENKTDFMGVTIPSTGAYIASASFDALDIGEIGRYELAIIDSVSKGDRVYIRYKNGICYARYVSAGVTIDPNEEMEIEETFILKYLPDDEVIAEILKAEVIYESTPFDYAYQWYRYGKAESEDDALPITGATTNEYLNLKDGYFYYCEVVGAVKSEPATKVTQRTYRYYHDKIVDLSDYCIVGSVLESNWNLEGTPLVNNGGGTYSATVTASGEAVNSHGDGGDAFAIIQIGYTSWDTAWRLVYPNGSMTNVFTGRETQRVYQGQSPDCMFIRGTKKGDKIHIEVEPFKNFLEVTVFVEEVVYPVPYYFDGLYLVGDCFTVGDMTNKWSFGVDNLIYSPTLDEVSGNVTYTMDIVATNETGEMVICDKEWGNMQRGEGVIVKADGKDYELNGEPGNFKVSGLTLGNPYRVSIITTPEKTVSVRLELIAYYTLKFAMTGLPVGARAWINGDAWGDSWPNGWPITSWNSDPKLELMAEIPLSDADGNLIFDDVWNVTGIAKHGSSLNFEIKPLALTERDDWDDADARILGVSASNLSFEIPNVSEGVYIVTIDMSDETTLSVGVQKE